MSKKTDSKKKHYRYAPSAAHRWLVCTAEPDLREAAGERESSDAAEEGTTAHWVGENCLRHIRDNKGKASYYVGKVCPETGIEVDEEMAEYVQVYVDDCLSGAMHAEWFGVESEFTLPAISKELGGTADWAQFTMLEREATGSLSGILTVRDLKFGTGYWVDVEDNPQLLIYALGALEQLRRNTNLVPFVHKIDIGICQPRIDTDQPIRAKVYTISELISWQEEVLRPAVDAAQNNPKTVPGDHCRFCPALSTCPAQHKQMVELAKIDFARPSRVPVAPHKLAPEKVMAVLEAAPMIRSWLKQIEAHGQTLLESGYKSDKFKLVAKRRNRSWRDGVESKIARMLGANAYKTPRLVSVKEAEDILKREGFVLNPALYDRPDTGYVIAPADDRRPAVVKAHPSKDFLEEDEL